MINAKFTDLVTMVTVLNLVTMVTVLTMITNIVVCKPNINLSFLNKKSYIPNIKY